MVKKTGIPAIHSECNASVKKYKCFGIDMLISFVCIGTPEKTEKKVILYGHTHILIFLFNTGTSYFKQTIVHSLLKKYSLDSSISKNYRLISKLQFWTIFSQVFKSITPQKQLSLKCLMIC